MVIEKVLQGKQTGNKRNSGISVPYNIKRHKLKLPEFKFNSFVPKNSFEQDFYKSDYLASQCYPAYNENQVANMTGLRREFVTEIMNHEGVKLEAYTDSTGHKTIGIGHNIDSDKSYNLGEHINKKQAFTLLKNDLNLAQKQLDSIVDVRKLTKGQKEALTDLIFNVGIDNVKNSKNLIEHLKNERYDLASKEFNFVLAKGEVSTALCQRRIAELSRFAEGTDKRTVKSAMQELYIRGLMKFNSQIKNSKNDNVDTLKVEKANYEKTCRKLISKTFHIEFKS